MIDYKIRDWRSTDLDNITSMHKDNFIDAWSLDMLSSSFKADGFLGGLIEVDNQIVCTVAFSSILGEAELLSIVTKKDFRGKGFAKILLSTYLDKLKTLGNGCVFLEVRSSNTPAKSLYQKLGFNYVAERKNYYGTESATIYKKEF